MAAPKKEYPPFLSQYLLKSAAPFVIYPHRDRTMKSDARALLENLARQFVEWRKTFQPRSPEPQVAEYLRRAGASDLDMFGQPALLDQLYSKDLLAAVPAFVKRTLSLRKLSLAGMPKSEPVAYLREAANCFIQGLFQACVALSRTAMELQLKARVAELLGQKTVAGLELKDLIDRSRLSRQSLTDATTVRRAGNDVLHVGATDTNKALAVLEATRRVIVELSPRGRNPAAANLTVDVFRAALVREFGKATPTGQDSLRIRAGDLHGSVGGYPGPDHRMPMCCQVMQAAMVTGDEIVERPPSGQGASLTIEYRLPRPE